MQAMPPLKREELLDGFLYDRRYALSRIVNLLYLLRYMLQLVGGAPAEVEILLVAPKDRGTGLDDRL